MKWGKRKKMGIRKRLAKVLLGNTDMYEVHFKGKCLVESTDKPDKDVLIDLMLQQGLSDIQNIEISQIRKKT